MVALAYSTLQNTPQSLAQAPTPQADIDRKKRMKKAWEMPCRLASKAKVCYNWNRNIVVSKRCYEHRPTFLIHLCWRSIVDILIQSSFDFNPPLEKRCTGPCQ